MWRFGARGAWYRSMKNVSMGDAMMAGPEGVAEELQRAQTVNEVVQTIDT